MSNRVLGRAAAAAVAAVFALLLAGAASAASPPSTPVHLTPAQVSQALFVAGDVGRLSQVPSGTEDVVVERVLQQLYAATPNLPSDQAVSDIRGLQAALTTGGQAISPATLTVMPGNERILAILRALTNSNPSPEVTHALAQVTNQALTASSESLQVLGQSFNASADALDTLSYGPFSPDGTLARSAALAATNTLFGQARDTLFKQASNESVFDSTQTLLAENPALQTQAIKTLTGMLNSDGSLDSTVGQLENLIKGGVQQIANQNCTTSSGASTATPGNCTSGALHDAQMVAQACPNGASDASANCMAARGQAQTDAPDQISTIAALQAATAAEATALNDADQALGQAEAAEAQAAAQLADEENQYLNYQSFQQTEKAGFDVAILAVTLSVSEIDPVAAVTGLLNVVGDAVGFGFSGPDPNTLILDGIQSIARSLSGFEQYTQAAFQSVDAQLSSISSQVSQIAAQITQAQQQLTQLATQLSTLQNSVDHLQSEVQTLFAAGANNDLGTLINQVIGYQKANGTALPQSQFAQAAGALYQDATSTALTPLVLTPPSGFDALHADSLVTGSDPLTLDSNINLFNLFGAGVSDAPGSIGFPGALTTTCPANANPGQGLCLPNPDFWATSARAFAQLLMENPSYVTPTRITQLSTIEQEGEQIANALGQLSANNAGVDAGGTGNKTLDAALAYFRYWGDANTHGGGTPPGLVQALKAEEQRYLGQQTVQSLPGLNDGVIDPWGGINQTPDVAGLQLKAPSLRNIQICHNVVGLYGAINPLNYELPSLPAGLISFINPVFLNAARLGLGTITPCWEAVDANVSGDQFDIVMKITYDWSDANVSNVAIGTAAGTLSATNDCAAQPDPMNPFTPDVLATVIYGWPTSPARVPGCPDVTPALTTTAQTPAAAVSSAVPALGGELFALRHGVYNDIISNGGGLTAGDGQGTDVQSAATRLDGANELLDGYISLGLPQALAGDDTLASLVTGGNADTFAPLTGGFGGVAPAGNVPAQIINLYKAEINGDSADPSPLKDPADLVGKLVDQRASALAGAINAHVVGGGNTPAQARANVRLGAGADATAVLAPTNTIFAEVNPVVGATLDRLAGTRLVLNDEMNPTPATSATPATPATPPTPTTTTMTPGAPPLGAKKSPARCSLKVTRASVLLAKPKKGNAKVTPDTVALTASCNQAAKVTLTGKLRELIGPKPKRGKQKSRTFALGPVRAAGKAGKPLTLIVKLPAAAIKALGKNASASATFTLAATTANATVRQTTKVQRVTVMG